MIRASAILIAVALLVLIAGVAASNLPLVYLSIGLSAIAMPLLATEIWRHRDEIVGEAAPERTARPPGAGRAVGGAGEPVMIGGRVKSSRAAGQGIPGEVRAAAGPDRRDAPGHPAQGRNAGRPDRPGAGHEPATAQEPGAGHEAGAGQEPGAGTPPGRADEPTAGETTAGETTAGETTAGGTTAGQARQTSAGDGRAGGGGHDGGPAGDAGRENGQAGAATANGLPDGEVAIVPGIARYHRPGCLLIRFLGGDDLQIVTREEAGAAGCVPCRACQPGQPVTT